MPYPIKCILPNDRVCFVNEELKIIDINHIVIDIDEDLKTTNENFKIFFNNTNTYQIISPSLLGQELGFIYSCHLIFLHESDLRHLLLLGVSHDKTIMADSQDNQIMCFNESDLVNKLEKCYNHSDLIIYYIGYLNGVNVGYGIFASKLISKGEYIGEYTGLVKFTADSSSKSFESESIDSDSITNEHLSRDAYSINYNHTDIYSIDIDASEQGNIIRLINHSNQPNCSFKRLFHEGLIHIICVSILSVLFYIPYIVEME
jgi:SET domain